MKNQHGVKESNLEDIREEQRAEQQLENRLDVVSAEKSAGDRRRLIFFAGYGEI